MHGLTLTAQTVHTLKRFPSLTSWWGCAGGVYCGDRGTPDLSVPCPGGHYCSVQSPAAMPCLPGTYCPPGSAMPIQCPGGSFCPMMSAEPSACPQGFFCPEGARTPVACPAGSRMNPYDMLRSSSSTACEPCAEVRCMGTGLDPQKKVQISLD